MQRSLREFQNSCHSVILGRINPKIQIIVPIQTEHNCTGFHENSLSSSRVILLTVSYIEA